LFGCEYHKNKPECETIFLPMQARVTAAALWLLKTVLIPFLFSLTITTFCAVPLCVLASPGCFAPTSTL